MDWAVCWVSCAPAHTALATSSFALGFAEVVVRCQPIAKLNVFCKEEFSKSETVPLPDRDIPRPHLTLPLSVKN